MRVAGLIVLVAACGFATRFADGQRVRPAVPFFGPATGFDPEISVVNSGAVLDAQVVVSNDQKYVTINARPSQSTLLALRSFTFQQGGQARLGFVGGAGPNNGNNINNQANLLNRAGMTFLGGLD